MKRSLLAVALLMLTWTAPPPTCNVWELRFNAKRFIQSGSWMSNEAWSLPPTDTVCLIAPEPLEGVVLWWSGPLAVSMDGIALSQECQPTGLTADGVSWEGL